MPDFNTKKEVLRKLQAKRRKNKLMWLPCVIAEGFVKMWYATVCRAGLALTDKNGKFLGIAANRDKAPRARRQDDIVYVKKSFWGRMVSAFLAAAFTLMFVPEIFPELDLGITASADAINRIPLIDENGQPTGEYVICVGSDTSVVYKEDEFYAATGYSVDKTDYNIGFGTFYIAWKPLDNNGYDLTQTEINSKIAGYKLQPSSNKETKPEEFVRTHTQMKSFSVGEYNNAWSVDITPVVMVEKWSFSEDPTTGKSIIGQLHSYSEFDAVKKTFDIGKLDAKFDPPTIKVVNTNTNPAGDTVDSCSLAELNDNKIKLIWDISKQKGGLDFDSPADGYVVYTYDMTNNTIDSGKAFSHDGTTNPVTTFLTGLTPGTRYQFFVEAYRYAWDKETGYNKNSESIISSSKDQIKADPSTKLSQIYGDFVKNLYVAPAPPMLTADYSKATAKTIYLSWKPSNGTYTGIELYRSIGELDPDKIPEVANETKTFAQWLKEQAASPTEDYKKYKIQGVGVVDYPLSKNTENDADNIAEGTQYYYYAIPYLRKQNLSKVYGMPAIVPALLDLSDWYNKSQTQITAKKGEDYVDLSWKSVANAEGYELEITQLAKYDLATNTVVPVEDPTPEIRKVTDVKFSHTGLYNGERYKYTVRPYIWIEDSNGKRPYYGEYSPAIAVTVGYGLDTPQITSVDGDKDGQVTVSWEKIDGATGYTLYYYNQTTGDKKSFKTTKTTYTQTKLNNDDVCEYYVVAYKTVNADSVEGGQLIESEPSEVVTVTVGRPLKTPQDLKVTTTDGTVNVSWAKVDGAEGYMLHYKVLKKDGTIIDYSDKTVFNVINNNYVHAGLNNGDRYTYYVVAYKEINGKTVYSPRSDEAWVIVGVPIDVPKDFDAVSSDGRVDLSWSAVKGAEGYILHIIGSSGTHERIDVSGTKYSHVGLKNGEVYTYYIQAYKTVNGERVYSDDSYESARHITVTVGDSLLAPKDFDAVAADGMVNVSWSAVQGATGYVLYAYSGGTNLQFDLSTTKFAHRNLKNGDIWTYYVVAYKDVNGSRVYSAPTVSKTVTVGDSLIPPKDFDATTSDGTVSLTWSAVQGATGYVLYAYSNGTSFQFDLSTTKYDHRNLKNGDKWTYYVVAYKDINGSRVYSSPTRSKTVTVGVSLNAVIDLVATAGNRQIDLSWSAVKGAEGYVVYLYNDRTLEFEPITVVSGTKYSHVGLKNGKLYTYMVAAFKTIDGERVYGDYSLSVDAIPTTGSITDMDHTLNVKGTTPYGISHSEYIAATANHGAFDESVDVYFTTNRESTNAVKDVLKHYADGLKSFIIYPFDISVYEENTRVEVDPHKGYTVTVTMPIPDRLIAYRDYITVVHIGDDSPQEFDSTNTNVIGLNDELTEWADIPGRRLEVLPSAIVDVDNVWCVQFVCSSFSPYALVIYKDNLTDVSAGWGILDGSLAGTFNSGVLLFTALPDIMPNNKKLKVVTESGKRYSIKKVEKK